MGASRRPEALAPGSYHHLTEAGNATTDAAMTNWWASFHDATLSSLIERAVKANLDLEIASSRLLEVRAARRVARADLFPQVGSSDSISRMRGGLTTGIFSVNQGPSARSEAPNLLAPFETNVFRLGFDASWEMDFFGRRRRSLEAATADVASFEEARRDLIVSLTAEVARNYAELRGLQRRLDIADENVALQAQSLELTRAQAEAGLGTQLDVERQAAQLDWSRSLAPSLEAAATKAIHRIGILLGEEPGAFLDELAHREPLPILPDAVPVGIPADLLKRRPDIRRAEARVAAETARVGIARADRFPRITLNAAGGRHATAPAGLTFGAGNYFSFGPAITLPIFDGGRIRANIEAQRQRLDQALSEYRSAVLRALEETENSLVAHGREKERRDRLMKAVESFRQATVLANELYLRGLTDFLSVLDAQRQQLAAEEALAQSETSVVISLVALYKALGGGWEIVPQR
jgi:NodT family efflux transporter outer membrane factor (OMF) lipoprotein